MFRTDKAPRGQTAKSKGRNSSDWRFVSDQLAQPNDLPWDYQREWSIHSNCLLSALSID